MQYQYIYIYINHHNITIITCCVHFWWCHHVHFSAVAPLRLAPSSLCPSVLREVPTVPAPPKVEGDSTNGEWWETLIKTTILRWEIFNSTNGEWWFNYLRWEIFKSAGFSGTDHNDSQCCDIILSYFSFKTSKQNVLTCVDWWSLLFLGLGPIIHIQ